MRQVLGSVRKDLSSSSERFQSLQHLQRVVVEHTQLSSVVQMLPQLFSVHQLLTETFSLLDSQRLLEAHKYLMDLEHLRDSILHQLCQRDLLSPSHQACIVSYFGGLLELNDTLAQHLWQIMARSTKLVSKDPSLLVSALRIVEREENLDSALLLRSQSPPGFLPPGRPKCWRQKFFQVIQDTIVAGHFQAVPRGAQDQRLAQHLASLQRSILAELGVVKDLMVQCCPPHYDILPAFVTMFHQALADHLRHLVTWDLDTQDIFALLRWALHVYPSSDMMAHPRLLPEVDATVLAPLLPTDTVQHLEETYLGKVQASIAEWLQKTLQMEFKEWFSEEEPESDYQGCFQTSLPTIVMKMLDENIHVASIISETLWQKMSNMALGELEAFLGSLYEHLVKFGKEHQREPAASKFYTPYLLSAVNNCLALSTSVTALYTDGTSPSEPGKIPPSLHAALEKAQKKACQLLLEETLADLQPLFAQLPSHQWLSKEFPLASNVCEVIERHAKDFTRARRPINLYLLAETEHLVMSQYVKALLQKKMVCRNAEERSQMARRMLQDASQLTETFCSLGLEDSKQTLKVIVDLQELLSLKDPSMISLEVLGFVTKYPDISDDHISMFLNLRGDISKEIRNSVLEIMAQNPQVLPENYELVFSNILVPAPEQLFCLGKSKCA